MDEVTQWYHDKRYSKITDRHPDPKVFPDFYKAKRMEFRLRPGEMIFIPAGMFHFVFSEDPDPETGLCAAINFWYERDAKNEEGDAILKPKFGWHDLHLKYDEILNVIRRDRELRVNRSSFGCFPPDFMKHRKWPGTITQYLMTYDEFLQVKNPEHYIAQMKSTEFQNFAIPYKKPLTDGSVWINWGNVNTIPHYDGMDNWLCQLKGTRRVILIPQSDRDLLYLLNPYPLKTLDKIYKMIKNKNKDENESSEFQHEEHGTLQPDIIEQLLESLGDDNEAVVGCEILEKSYEREIETASPTPPPHPRWKTFRIKRYIENEDVPNKDYMGMTWFLSDGQISINGNIVNIGSGNAISFTPKVPVKVLTDCIIITPYGFSDGN
jgi:hypothetical protein